MSRQYQGQLPLATGEQRDDTGGASMGPASTGPSYCSCPGANPHPSSHPLFSHSPATDRGQMALPLGPSQDHASASVSSAPRWEEQTLPGGHYMHEGL